MDQSGRLKIEANWKWKNKIKSKLEKKTILQSETWIDNFTKIMAPNSNSSVAGPSGTCPKSSHTKLEGKKSKNKVLKTEDLNGRSNNDRKIY